MDLTLNQTRVIGCLIEKEITTPDQYPLSLNALTLACNQKSNRDPVLNLSDSEVQNTLDELAQKRMTREESGFGSRVVKYKHRFCNTEFGELQLKDQELGIVCVLFLRGPQTPGELRSRTNRLCSFSDVHEVETVLELLSERIDGPFVARLPREPGKRESRYAHLFSGEVEADTAPLQRSVAQAPVDDDRVAVLEQQVADLRDELMAVKAQLDELLS
ncbi:MAG: DUF480 domain-containing protein [Halopseudomonas sp.]